MSLKSNMKQKRLFGTECPHSKRAKLEFTPRRESSKKVAEEKPSNGDPFGEAATGSDWDDDFSGDLLEKVCLIADLSQAMVSNKPEEKGEVEIVKDNKSPSPKPGLGHEEYEKLKSDYEKLLEKLRTKEGEVYILRSQLKQKEDINQKVAVQDFQFLENMKKKYKEKITEAEKETENAKMKLQFRDMENKLLSEKYKLLELKRFGQKVNLDDINEAARQVLENHKAKLFLQFSGRRFSPPAHHEGFNLALIICPEFFKPLEEPSVIPLYTLCRKAEKIRKKGKKKKEKWENFPKASVQTKHLHESVISLFEHEKFQYPNKILDKVLESCCDILTHSHQVLLFLRTLKGYELEHEDRDESLLDNENPVEVLTVKNLLDGRRLNEEECGVEGRRSLALVYSLVKTSRATLDALKRNVNFFKLLKNLSATIGSLKRPLRYSGTLVGITLILRRILAEKDLDKEVLGLINEIVEEVIFARPKLDVLREVVNVLSAGKHHFAFLETLCRKSPLGSYSLYLNTKLKQAMFVTKTACPLNVLCMQVMGLAGLPSGRSIRWEITVAFVNWIDSLLSSPHWKTIKWLPVNRPQTREPCCYDVTECLLYLLTLCFNDYNLECLLQDTDSDNQNPTRQEERKSQMEIIGRGAVLLKRILMADQRQAHCNAFPLRFAALLKNLNPGDAEVLSPEHAKAISWIADFLECNLEDQETCAKEYVDPGVDPFDALKMSFAENKIY